jgi:hypothetical protein
MFDIYSNGKVYNSGLNWAVARGVIEWLARYNQVKIVHEGKEITLAQFNALGIEDNAHILARCH